MGIIFDNLGDVVKDVEGMYKVELVGDTYLFERTGPYGRSLVHYRPETREISWDVFTGNAIITSRLPPQPHDIAAARWLQRVLLVLAYSRTDQRPLMQRQRRAA